MNYGILNVVSILLGLSACAVPAICLVRKKYRMVFALASFVACMLAQLLLMLYLWHLVSLRDLSALLGVTPVLVLFSAALTVATITLNCICAIRARRDKRTKLELSLDGTTDMNSHI